MTAAVSMEVQYVTPGGTLTYDGMTLFQDMMEDTEAAGAVGGLDSLSDVVLTSPANGQIIRHNGTNWVNGAGITLQTAVAAASQTEINFTGVPSWVNRITVMGRGLSTNGTSPITIRVGDGAIVSTGYLGAVTNIAGATPATSNDTAGCLLVQAVAATSVYRFSCRIERLSGNTWVFSGTGAFSSSATTTIFASEITLSGNLDRVRITTNGGADQFDAGSVNISWE